MTGVRTCLLRCRNPARSPLRHGDFFPKFRTIYCLFPSFSLWGHGRMWKWITEIFGVDSNFLVFFNGSIVLYPRYVYPLMSSSHQWEWERMGEREREKKRKRKRESKNIGSFPEARRTPSFFFCLAWVALFSLTPSSIDSGNFGKFCLTLSPRY